MLSLNNEDLCRNRWFKTNLLNLPKIIQLIDNPDPEVNLKINYADRSEFPSNPSEKECWSYLTLDYAKFGQLGKCVEFVKTAILEGDNVGEDEFKDNDELMDMLSLSEVFVLKSLENDEISENIRAFIAVQPCLTSRTVDTCLGSIFVYYDQKWIKSGYNIYPEVLYVKEETYMALLHLGIQLTKDIKIGYTECVMRVCLASNLERMQAMRRYGFEIAVNIPEGVLIKGHLERDYVVVNKFDQLRMPRGDDEIKEVINRVYSKEKCDQIFKSVHLKTVPFLPRLYKLINGNMLRIRNATKADAAAMYNLFLQATKEGRGYGCNEFPTIDAFKMWLMIDNYCFVYEHIDSSKASSMSTSSLLSNTTDFEMAGCSFVGDSWHVRTMASRAVESSVVISSRFRGQGLGKEILILEIGLMKQLNYKIMVNDFLTSNSQMRGALSSIFKENDYVSLGILQNVSYTQGIGWDGQEIRLCDLQKPHLKYFTEIVNENNQRYGILSKL